LFIVQDQSWKEYSSSKLPGIKERVEAIKKIIPPFTKYLTGSHITPITAGPIVRSEYVTSVRPNQTMLDWKKIQRDYPQFTHYPEAHSVTLVKIGSSPPNAYATTTSLNFNKNFTPKEWGVIYAHELGHYFGNTGLGLYEKYHKWKGPGDKHCPYNCLFHHYMSCGNIADGNEEAVYDTFVRSRQINTEIADPKDPPMTPPVAVTTKTGDEEHVSAFIKRARTPQPPSPYGAVGQRIQIGRRRNLN